MQVEEKLREACCIGDTEAVLTLINQNIDVNSRNNVNGWTPLHWACKRGQEEIVQILLNHGANGKLENNVGETPANLCTNANILNMLGETRNPTSSDDLGLKFTPNYIRNAPLNGQVDIGRLRPKHDFSSLPKTTLPAAQSDDLVLKLRVAHSADSDFIEVELPRCKLTYNNLLKLCCEELQVDETQVDRIRKLPDTRLRRDSDIRRLVDNQALEIVLKPSSVGDKSNNCYQSISSCKNQTILY